MKKDINKIICDAIDEAFTKKIMFLGRDITYPCMVTQVYPDNENTYQLTYQNINYVVTLSNIKLNLYDKVHLVAPQGDFKNKFVLEDVCHNYTATITQ